MARSSGGRRWPADVGCDDDDDGDGNAGWVTALAFVDVVLVVGMIFRPTTISVAAEPADALKLRFARNVARRSAAVEGVETAAVANIGVANVLGAEAAEFC